MAREPGPRTPPGAAPLSGVEQVAAGVPRDHPFRNVLTIPGNRVALVESLAYGLETSLELAERYGVSRNAIYYFRDTHADEIRAARERAGVQAPELARLWIANTAARVEELQGIYERLHKMYETAGVDDAPELARTLVSVLHEAAEQLGQLPTRVQVQNTTIVQYDIVGVDVDKL